MLLSRTDYDTLHSIVFRPGYPGYKPEVVEIPNGDGNPDALKRYAHIAPKYYSDPKCDRYPGEIDYLQNLYTKALEHAQDVFAKAGGNPMWAPDYKYSALRILDYPPGATSAPHRDFDLFTSMVYREHPKYFHMLEEVEMTPALAAMRQIDPQLHLGELGELLGMGAATLHEVFAAPVRQRSMVFFAIPNHDLIVKAAFDQNITIKDWLNERMARSRSTFDPYK